MATPRAEAMQRLREEEELRKRLGEFYNIHYLKMPFYRYRMHGDNKTKEPEYEDLLNNSKNFHATTDLKEGLDFSWYCGWLEVID